MCFQWLRSQQITLPNLNPKYSGLCRQLASKAAKVPGAFVPRCESDGSFAPMQAHPSNFEKWCVDTITGVEIPGTRGLDTMATDCSGHDPSGNKVNCKLFSSIENCILAPYIHIVEYIDLLTLLKTLASRLYHF